VDLKVHLFKKWLIFFWNVGAPEGEIDRLNDVGATLNPERIGSWIDMSAKGGMDGGWFFPVKIPFENASQATDKISDKLEKRRSQSGR